MLEHCVRDELNRTALRRIAVMDPLKIKITNFNNLNIAATCEVQNVPNETAIEMGINLTRHLNISDTIYIGTSKKHQTVFMFFIQNETILQKFHLRASVVSLQSSLLDSSTASLSFLLQKLSKTKMVKLNAWKSRPRSRRKPRR